MFYYCPLLCINWHYSHWSTSYLPHKLQSENWYYSKVGPTQIFLLILFCDWCEYFKLSTPIGNMASMSDSEERPCWEVSKSVCYRPYMNARKCSFGTFSCFICWNSEKRCLYARSVKLGIKRTNEQTNKRENACLDMGLQYVHLSGVVQHYGYIQPMGLWICRIRVACLWWKLKLKYDEFFCCLPSFFACWFGWMVSYWNWKCWLCLSVPASIPPLVWLCVC